MGNLAPRLRKITLFLSHPECYFIANRRFGRNYHAKTDVNQAGKSFKLSSNCIWTWQLENIKPHQDGIRNHSPSMSDPLRARVLFVNNIESWSKLTGPDRISLEADMHSVSCSFSLTCGLRTITMQRRFVSLLLTFKSMKLSRGRQRAERDIP